MITQISKIINTIPEDMLNEVQLYYSKRVILIIPGQAYGFNNKLHLLGHNDSENTVRVRFGILPVNTSISRGKGLLNDAVANLCRHHQNNQADCKETNLEYMIKIIIEQRFFQDVCLAVFHSCNIEFPEEPVNLNPNMIRLLYTFIEEYNNRESGSDYVLQSLNYQITVEVLRSIFGDVLRGKTDIKKSMKKHKEKESIDRSVQYLKKHATDSFSLEKLAKMANLSLYHFIRVFRIHTEKTPYEYYLDLKIEKAMEHLVSNSGSVTEICYLCGFNNPSHFTALFKKKVGLTPSEFRKSNS